MNSTVTLEICKGYGFYRIVSSLNSIIPNRSVFGTQPQSLNSSTSLGACFFQRNGPAESRHTQGTFLSESHASSVKPAGDLRVGRHFFISQGLNSVPEFSGRVRLRGHRIPPQVHPIDHDSPSGAASRSQYRLVRCLAHCEN